MDKGLGGEHFQCKPRMRARGEAEEEQGSDEGGPEGFFCIFGFAAISRWIFNVSNCLHSFRAVIL